MDDGPPPPPPPHGENPHTTEGEYRKSSDLPPGNYDIFVVPPHSAGSGFLYLPSLETHRNSFFAGVISTLLVVVAWSLVSPAIKTWYIATVSSGNGSANSIGTIVVAVGVGVAGWALGSSQSKSDGVGGGNNGGNGTGGFGGGFFGGSGTGRSNSNRQSYANSNSSGHRRQQHGGSFGGGQQRGNQYQQENEQEQEKSEPPPKPDEKDEQEKAEREREKEREREREREREETKRKEELRRKMEEFKRKREAEAKEKERKREREAMEKELRERREQLEREMAAARAAAEKEAREKMEKEAAEARAAAEKLAAEAKAARDKIEAEAKERAAKEAAEKEAAAKEKAQKEAMAKFAALKEAAAKRYAEKKAQEAKEKAASKPAPNAASATSAPRTPSPKKQPPFRTARTTVEEDDAYSFRPYDRPRRPYGGASGSSAYSESSYAPSQSTARTTPPPSHRSSYSTKDPDKIVIQGVAWSQMVSVLRMTTEGLFVDDDLRGVGQREWDVKAWTLKLTEVWCPQLGAPSKDKQPSSNPFSFRRGAGTHIPTSEESDAFTANLLKVCKNTCRLASPSACFARSANAGGSDGARVNPPQAEFRGLHVLRASLRDQEGKKYVFVLQDTEAWKVAIGLQRLRGGALVRGLGVTALPAPDCKSILGGLGYI
ncbi:hypothetical protein N7468_001499 [Penicillium chermesinum]|uniref:Uncharacterized protein n=1 Tax=Penicillium chermesinum TaxID=63820 RepID=A0A9W9TWM0_9EURO|nr:uncharacterized protein N7468_001499 [Penicillium chermesinum]KAJ5246516.1 hypothetical protein N7468_001499 [Penicillium chermesinum]